MGATGARLSDKVRCIMALNCVFAGEGREWLIQEVGGNVGPISEKESRMIEVGLRSSVGEC